MLRAYMYIFGNVGQTILGSCINFFIVSLHILTQANLVRSIMERIDLENGSILFYFSIFIFVLIV